MKVKSKGEVSLIGKGKTSVKVCDVINGRPKVKIKKKDDCIEVHLWYSLLHREIKRYDKDTYQEILPQ